MLLFPVGTRSRRDQLLWPNGPLSEDFGPHKEECYVAANFYTVKESHAFTRPETGPLGRVLPEPEPE